MPEYLDDPSVLTKDKLKSELLAHNVELPTGNPTKDVYVQLYLTNLTSQNKKHAGDIATTWDAFSSDEELPPPVVSSRSRSSGRKATRKTDKVLLEELDVTMLTDEGLRDELLKHGVDVGPVVASTRKLYEKKLQKLLDNGPLPTLVPVVVLTEAQVNHNGHSESDLYSDKEDDVITPPEPAPVPEPEPEPEPELEPTPVVERPLRSRGKTPVTTRTRSNQRQTTERGPADVQLSGWRQQKITKFLHAHSPPRTPCSTSTLLVPQVEKITASEQNTKVIEKDVLKELFPIEFNTPTGISATCRRPIKGAAGRPLQPSDLWNNENSLFSPKITSRTSSSSSSYTESRIVNKVTSLPPSHTSSSSLSSSSSLASSSRLLSATPPAGQTKAARRGMSLWVKLFLLAIVAAFLFFVYQAMESNSINPFLSADKDVSSGSAA
ncbi:thymopoietin a isoform X2 [Cynoglossus semilaevis]|uniref:Thymopoietin a n=1 Tax=Cynoglossus semilaevis TaxID=244447 RepID=A0A3P8WI20_CYNSE|nr:thymopoietin isoform X2 [Cynoglossus semilaevis]